MKATSKKVVFYLKAFGLNLPKFGKTINLPNFGKTEVFINL